jgi:hypothetical protein
MQLDFTTLSQPLQKQVGHGGTGGTPSIHAGFGCPTMTENRWDRVGHLPASVDHDSDLSHLSHHIKTEVGHVKPAWIMAVPHAPPVPPKKHKASQNSELAASLDQFRFDVVQSDIDAGYPADELQRVNNMAWAFMQADGMGFEEAITRAAVIVAASQIAASEAAYVDVLALFMRMQTKGEG